MSGAEVIIALGVVSSIITCINMSSMVVDRLEYYISRTKQPPQTFRTLHDQLPLLIQTFEENKTTCEKEKISVEQQKSLLKTVQGCVRLTKVLEAILEECLPSPDDSLFIKGKKVIKSIKAEKKIAELHPILETYKSTLTLYFSHFTVMASPGQSLPAVAAESKFYYEIPAIRVNHFVGRKYLLDRIHKFFKSGALVVVLTGMGGKAPRTELGTNSVLQLIYIAGQGKTQLSLEYCRAERSENSIFWFDATSMGTGN